MPEITRSDNSTVFIHIPKCGGSSVDYALEKDFHLSIFHSGKGDLPCSPQHFHADLLNCLYNNEMPPSVTIVRHPLIRLLSEYYYHVQHYKLENTSFDRFALESLSGFWNDKYIHDNHIRPQSEFVSLNTHIFRLEENGISKALAHLYSFFGQTYAHEKSNSRLNESMKFELEISIETQDLINQFYQRDFEFFGYTPIQRESSLNTVKLSELELLKGKVRSPQSIRMTVEQDSKHRFKDDISRSEESLEGLQLKLIQSTDTLQNEMLSEMLSLKRSMESLKNRETESLKKIEDDISRRDESLEGLQLKLIHSTDTLQNEMLSEMLSLKRSMESLKNREVESRIDDEKRYSKVLTDIHSEHMHMSQAQENHAKKHLDILSSQNKSLTEIHMRIEALEQSLASVTVPTTNELLAGSKIEQLQKEYANLVVAYDKAVDDNQAVWNSYSMKATSPLRMGLDFLLGIRRIVSGRFKGVPETNAPAIHIAEETSIEPDTDSQISKVCVAILVENMDKGGLEQVVLDHASFFSDYCAEVVIYVAGKPGYLSAQAIEQGIAVQVLSSDSSELETHLNGRRYNFAFIHHTYTHLEAFREVTNCIIEVLHNTYSWQVSSNIYPEIRECIDSYIAVSDCVRQYSIENLGVDAAKVHTIENGLRNTGLLRPPSELLSSQRSLTFREKPTFICSANGYPQKNHALLIRAFGQFLESHSNARLFLAGDLEVDSQTSDAIEQELSHLDQTDSIVLLGSLDRRELSRYLSEAHIAVLPSDHEGFSIATLEYLYFGLPMLLSPTGGADYIKSKFASALVPGEDSWTADVDVDEKSERLLSYLEKSLCGYEALSQRAQIAFQQYNRYSIEYSCGLYLETMSCFLDSPPEVQG